MKKTNISFLILMIFLLTGCNSDHDADTVKDGTYVMEQDGIEEVFLPSVKISEDQIVFSYDLLSSYLSIGSYIIDDGKLMMTTDDNKFTYVFKIDGDNLVFQKDESSSVKMIDERLGVKITDKAKFHRKEE